MPEKPESKASEPLVIPCCFWCLAPKSDPIPASWLQLDENEMPRDREPVLLDYDPCPACKEKMESGILFIGGVDACPSDNRPEIREGSGVYPTGRYIVLGEEDAEDLMKKILPGELIKQIMKARQCVVADELVQNLIDAYLQKSAEDAGFAES